MVTLTAIDPKMIILLATFPWIADGVSDHEWSAFEAILRLERNSIDTLRLLARSPWVAAGPDASQSSMVDVVASLGRIGQGGTVPATLILSTRWVADGINPTEAIILSAISENVSPGTDQPEFPLFVEMVEVLLHLEPDAPIIRGMVDRAYLISVEDAAYRESSLEQFYEIASLPWFVDGVDSTEAVATAILPTIRAWSEEPPGNPPLPTKTISLPLAGDVNIWLLHSDPNAPSEEEFLKVIEDTARVSEEFMGTPFPTTDIVVEIADPETYLAIIGGPCSHAYVKIILVGCSINVVSHEMAHYYFNGDPFYHGGEPSPTWFDEGGAEFIQALVNDRTGMQTLSDRKVELSEDLARLKHEQGFESIAHLNHLEHFTWDRLDFGRAPYRMGENFLIRVYETIGKEATAAALRELHRPAQGYFPAFETDVPPSEEDIYDTFLRYTPTHLKDAFISLYRKLHGGAFAYTGALLEDDHGSRPSKATAIEVGQVVEGNLDYTGDLDYFRFRAGKGQKYRLRVNHESLPFSGISLYTYQASDWFNAEKLSSEQRNWKAQQQTPLGPQILWAPQRSAESYLVVMNYGGYTGPYTVTITEIDDPEDDHGDVENDATEFSVGEVISGTVDDAFDYDYFRLEVVADQGYQVEFMPGNTLEAVRIRLYARSSSAPDGWLWGGGFHRSDSIGPNGKQLAVLRPWTSAEYFFVVQGLDDHTGTYAFQFLSEVEDAGN